MCNLKELYNKNINIMQFLREKNFSEENNSSIILASYDLQAGSYSNYVENNIMDYYYYNGKKVKLCCSEYQKIKFDFIAEKFNLFIPNHDKLTVLEAGTGEATSLVPLIQHLPSNIDYYGFDISLSRIQAGNSFCAKYNVNPKLFCADMYNIPLADNSIDIIFTSHAIEPNTNNELKIVSELYRVCSQFLILIEPSYELGNEETKKNIIKHCYIKNLKHAINTLDCEILFHDLLPISTYSNMSEIFIVKKNQTIQNNNLNYVCPQCKKELILHNNNYFCPTCLVVYPILNNIPDLNINHGIFFSQYLK